MYHHRINGHAVQMKPPKRSVNMRKNGIRYLFIDKISHITVCQRLSSNANSKKMKIKRIKNT